MPDDIFEYRPDISFTALDTLVVGPDSSYSRLLEGCFIKMTVTKPY